MIYVALNYRLGAFGWLSGPSFEQNGTSNVGLYDQRLALQWVQQNIAKFGGDPKRVTVMGESAGAGGITHQITVRYNLLGFRRSSRQRCPGRWCTVQASDSTINWLDPASLS